MRFVPVLSEATPEDQWSGPTGFVHRAVMEDFPDLTGYQVNVRRSRHGRGRAQGFHRPLRLTRTPVFLRPVDARESGAAELRHPPPPPARSATIDPLGTGSGFRRSQRTAPAPGVRPAGAPLRSRRAARHRPCFCGEVAQVAIPTVIRAKLVGSACRYDARKPQVLAQGDRARGGLLRLRVTPFRRTLPGPRAGPPALCRGGARADTAGPAPVSARRRRRAARRCKKTKNPAMTITTSRLSATSTRYGGSTTST